MRVCTKGGLITVSAVMQPGEVSNFTPKKSIMVSTGLTEAMPLQSTCYMVTSNSCVGTQDGIEVNHAAAPGIHQATILGWASKLDS